MVSEFLIMIDQRATEGQVDWHQIFKVAFYGPRPLSPEFLRGILDLIQVYNDTVSEEKPIITVAGG